MEKLSDEEIQELLDSNKHKLNSISDDNMNEDLRQYHLIFEELQSDDIDSLPADFATEITKQIFLETERKRDLVYLSIIWGIAFLTLGIIVSAFLFYNLSVNLPVEKLITKETTLIVALVAGIILFTQFVDKISVSKFNV